MKCDKCMWAIWDYAEYIVLIVWHVEMRNAQQMRILMPLKKVGISHIMDAVANLIKSKG